LKVDEDEEMVVSEGIFTIYCFHSSLKPRNVERTKQLSVVLVTDVQTFQVGCMWGFFLIHHKSPHLLHIRVHKHEHYLSRRSQTMVFLSFRKARPRIGRMAKVIFIFIARRLD
jgi:hypothetical protein